MGWRIPLTQSKSKTKTCSDIHTCHRIHYMKPSLPKSHFLSHQLSHLTTVPHIHLAMATKPPQLMIKSHTLIINTHLIKMVQLPLPKLDVGNLTTHCSFRLAEEVGYIVYVFQLSGSYTDQKAWLKS